MMDQVPGTIIRIRRFETHSDDGNAAMSYAAPGRGKRAQVFVAMLIGIEDKVIPEDQLGDEARTEKLLEMLKQSGFVPIDEGEEE